MAFTPKTSTILYFVTKEILKYVNSKENNCSLSPSKASKFNHIFIDIHSFSDE